MERVQRSSLQITPLFWNSILEMASNEIWWKSWSWSHFSWKRKFKWFSKTINCCTSRFILFLFLFFLQFFNSFSSFLIYFFKSGGPHSAFTSDFYTYYVAFALLGYPCLLGNFFKKRKINQKTLTLSNSFLFY